MRENIQRFGRFLSGMVMPNISAFIAWGLITTLFIGTGWLPNETFVKLVDPMILYLLPLLIAYTGGRMVHGVRGGVIGAVTAIGLIVGASKPQFLAAMVMGPLAAYVLRKIDEFLADKIPSGFEMLVNNFTAGILGAGLSMLCLVGIGPVFGAFSDAMGSAVQAIVDQGLLPLVSLVIEPAKILFLNNAINHGVLGPLGIAEVAT